MDFSEQELVSVQQSVRTVEYRVGDQEQSAQIEQNFSPAYVRSRDEAADQVQANPRDERLKKD